MTTRSNVFICNQAAEKMLHNKALFLLSSWVIAYSIQLCVGIVYHDCELISSLVNLIMLGSLFFSFVTLPARHHVSSGVQFFEINIRT